MNEKVEAILCKWFKDPVDKTCSYCEAQKEISALIEQVKKEVYAEVGKALAALMKGADVSIGGEKTISEICGEPTNDALEQARQEGRREDLPKVVCLCGSTKFKQEFIKANFAETMAGNIILTVGWFGHADGATYTLTADEKVMLDELHKRKIDLADEVMVINVGGYIGESTRSEIAYAEAHNKPVRYLEQFLKEKGLEG